MFYVQGICKYLLTVYSLSVSFLKSSLTLTAPVSGSTWKYLEALPLPTNLYRTRLFGTVASASLATTVWTRVPMEDESSIVTGRIIEVNIGALSFLS